MPFLLNPNLPENDVVLAAVSSSDPFILKSLTKQGITLIPINPYSALSAPISSHADMLCHPLGDKKIVVAKGNTQLIELFLHHGFEVYNSNKCLTKKYPDDIALNALRVGNSLFANPSGLDLVIKEFCDINNITIIPVRQGYARCSTVLVDTYSMITADESIAEAAIKNGFEILKIQPGYINLPGYPYGFLGGASGFIGKKKLAFTGALKSHPDCAKIKEFLNRREIECIYLSDQPLIDIGGIIPLKEQES